MKGLRIDELSEYRIPILPHTRRRARNRYQNLSLAGKLRWRKEICHMHASLIESGVYNEKTGGLDLFALAKRSKRFVSIAEGK